MSNQNDPRVQGSSYPINLSDFSLLRIYLGRRFVKQRRFRTFYVTHKLLSDDKILVWPKLNVLCLSRGKKYAGLQQSPLSQKKSPHLSYAK